MQVLSSRLGLALAVLALVAGPALAAEPFHSRRSPVVEAVQKTRASIVTIRVPRFGGGKDLIGTGVIIDERGFIVTNRHVVGTQQQVNVRLSDDTPLVGEVIVSDAHVDIAVLRIRTERPLVALALAPVSDLMVGESVIAVGHPFGYTNTVSTGIVSALGREITMPSGDTILGLIQTDASINPGNSGGPLLNINGELIGINVALREGAQGIAFAINAGTVKSVLSQHLSAARVAGVEHGLRCSEKIIGEAGERQRVVVAGAASNVDVQAGDEILAIGNWQVSNAFDVERALWDKRPGQEVALKIVRQGRTQTVTLTLSAGAPESPLAVAPVASRLVAPAIDARGVAAVGPR